ATMSVRQRRQRVRFARAAGAPRRKHERRQEERGAADMHRWSPKKGKRVAESLPAPTGKRMSTRASLCALGLRVQHLRLFRALYQSVKISQKKVLYGPVDKLVDCMLGMMCGVAGVCGVNNTVRADVAISLAFGRNGCAEASVIQETLNACTEGNVAQLQGVLKEQLHQHGKCTHHDFKRGLLILDIDFSGQQAGKQAEGSVKCYLAGKRNKRGRQLIWVYASQYDEIVCQWMMPGNTSCNSKGVLQAIVERAQEVLGLTDEQRRRTLIRTDAGFGTMENINWLLEQGYQVLMKAHNQNHVKKVAGTVRQWEESRCRGYEMGWPERPHVYVQPTVQLALRNLKKEEKWECHLLVSTLAALTAAQLKALYNRRGGHPESSFQQDKAGLKLITRQKKSMQAQQMLIGLGQMAHNILVWARRWPKDAGKESRFERWGIERWVRDLLTIPGFVVFGGQQVRIVLSEAHPLSQGYADAYGGFVQRSGGLLLLGET
ncbi:MAG TPA: transposase, partial [Chloroflexota bacterium]|nr:transposase [Chloroflexota bacterium]